jgi:hypothetical protein
MSLSISMSLIMSIFMVMQYEHEHDVNMVMNINTGWDMDLNMDTQYSRCGLKHVSKKKFVYAIGIIPLLKFTMSVPTCACSEINYVFNIVLHHRGDEI